VRGPSRTTSSTPVMVTRCWNFQLPASKRRLPGLTVPSFGSVLARGMTTGAVGGAVSDTSKLVWPPASVVARPMLGWMDTPPGGRGIDTFMSKIGAGVEKLETSRMTFLTSGPVLVNWKSEPPPTLPHWVVHPSRWVITNDPAPCVPRAVNITRIICWGSNEAR
jgi:hypothetical protein